MSWDITESLWDWDPVATALLYVIRFNIFIILFLAVSGYVRILFQLNEDKFTEMK